MMNEAQSNPVEKGGARAWAAAAGWSLVLSLTFLVVYGGCNWITTRRADVGTVYFAWEKSIPFLPWMILPYMSIDFFFVAAPFLCQSRDERRTLARRILFAIGVSGVCFLLFPLRYGWPRPEVSGWLGTIFAPLNALDQPHNLAPSLHISLRWILWAVYSRRTRGLLREGLKAWFLLIGASTLFVYQHHVIDILTGDLVALLCFYAFPGEQAATGMERGASARRLPLAGAYAGGALLCLAPMLLPWPGKWLMLWPAFALGMVAAAYAGCGPAVFRKYGGRLSLPARLLLAPQRMGNWLSFRLRTWSQPSSVSVAPGVMLGRRLSAREARAAVARGVTAVLDLTAEYSEVEPFLRLAYKNVPVLDLTAAGEDSLREAADFIREQAARGTVYVHCALGYSRSACAVAAYLLAEGLEATAEMAVQRVRQLRPEIVIPAKAMRRLRRLERRQPLRHSGPAPCERQN